jgi:hypothetical protein
MREGQGDMRMDRNIQVLVAGLKAAHERMFSDKGLRRPEYPRDLQTMCSTMEDSVYDVFNAIQNKKYTLVRESAADVIVNASKIIEHAEFLAYVANKSWRAEDYK